MVRNARSRAKKNRLPFALTVADIHIPDRCPVLGLRLKSNRGSKCAGDNSPSLDRIVPEKGYVSGNVIVVSNLANRIRNNATVEQLLKVATFYKFLLDEREID